MNRKVRPIEERFWEKVDKSNGDDGCWIWMAGKRRGGYGRFSLGRKEEGCASAHIVAWELTYNKKVPEGLILCHKCDNPACVNPAHIFLGTYKDNTQDAILKKRLVTWGEDSPRAKLTWDNVDEIRKMRKEGETLKYIACAFSVSIANIHEIVSNKTWIRRG